jgi:hypothetical protein
VLNKKAIIMKMKLTLALIIAILTMIAEGCNEKPVLPVPNAGSPTNNRPPVAKCWSRPNNN